MNGAKWYLVSYDVRDPKRLRKAAKKLEGQGERMQYSVFRVWLTSRQMQKLRWELTEILADEDDVMFLPLCTDCVRGICSNHLGNSIDAWPREPPRYHIV